MKLNRGQEKAIRLLVKRCVTITLMALLMGHIVFLSDKFLATRVFRPLCDLAMLNMDISEYKECESKYVGYQDTTQYSEKITELTEMRKKNFYHSDDAIVANLSTQNSLIKMFLLMVSVVLIPAIPLGVLFIVIVWYARTIIRFRIAWKKTVGG